MFSGGGGERGVDSFTCINNIAYVYLLFYSPHFQVFFTYKVCTRETEMTSTMHITMWCY